MYLAPHMKSGGAPSTLDSCVCFSHNALLGFSFRSNHGSQSVLIISLFLKNSLNKYVCTLTQTQFTFASFWDVFKLESTYFSAVVVCHDKIVFHLCYYMYCCWFTSLRYNIPWCDSTVIDLCCCQWNLRLFGFFFFYEKCS